MWYRLNTWRGVFEPSGNTYPCGIIALRVLKKVGEKMIVISKAILHIMDFNSGATIYSGAELDMGAPGTYDFLAGHIDKLFKDASAKTGQFLPESIFSQTASNYLDEHITFSDFSAGICKDLDTCLTDAGETDIVDVVVCDLRSKRSVIWE